MPEEKVIEFEIPEGIEDIRIDKAIALETHMSRSVIADIFKLKKVSLNGKAVKRSEKVSVGDEIKLFVSELESETIIPQDIEIDIVFEDDSLIAINKKPGMVVHPGAGNPDSTLVNALCFKYPQIVDVGEPHRPGIVHRLDAGTSGLLVVAKTNEAYQYFIHKFSTHDVTRNYTALVWGKFETTSGVIDAPIGRNASRATRMSVKEGGKRAVTKYEVVNYFEDKNVSLIEVSLETGRTHQIRVHCAAISHPIVGDRTYGGYRQSLECPRPFLHAHTLRFEHPVSREKMKFSVPLPSDLQVVLSRVEDV